MCVVNLRLTLVCCGQTLMGTDIADLLLEGHEPESRTYARVSAPTSHVAEASVNTSITDDRQATTSGVSGNTTELTDRFRLLLLHGRKKVNIVVCNVACIPV